MSRAAVSLEAPDYEIRVQAFEAMGLTRSDAQGVVDAEDMQRNDARGFQVRIIDCEKAGLIGGPFQVVVLKGGRMVASTSGIQGPTGAEGVAQNYRSAYGLPRFDEHGDRGAASGVSPPPRAEPEGGANPGEGDNSPGSSPRLIIVSYRSVDGYSKRRRYSTLEGARRFAQKMIGPAPSFGSGYAVSDDGIGTIRAQGATLAELFPRGLA